MTNWRSLRHAYGSAEDVPALLDQLTPDPEANVWGELWSRICHQGSVYSASFPAIPVLTSVAGNWNPKERFTALVLAGFILASNDVRGGTRDEFFRPVESVVPRLRELCRESLAESGFSCSDFVYLLQAARVFEGDLFWGKELDHMVDGEFPGYCPHCRDKLSIVISKYGCFVTAEEWSELVSSDPITIAVKPGIKRTPIEPGAELLPEAGQWMLDCARVAQQIDVANWIKNLFGTSRCPTCGRMFAVTSAIVARQQVDG